VKDSRKTATAASEFDVAPYAGSMTRSYLTEEKFGSRHQWFRVGDVSAQPACTSF